MKIVPSKRLEKLSSAIFTEMQDRKKTLQAQGKEIIDLGIGSPDKPPHPELIETLIEAVRNPSVYGYPNFQGNKELKQAIADWYQFRFNVKIDHLKGEVLAPDGFARRIGTFSTSFY